MRRRWSSSVSVLRVTFSVAMTVRPATSLRISWIARRVSCSMSRRVCSMSSSRRRRASATDSASWFSAARLARAMISSAWSRAAWSRSRYSASSSSASRRARSDASRVSSIAFWRLSSAFWMRGNTALLRMYIATPKVSSVQTISPMPGWTRKLPLPAATGSPVIGLEEERDQTEDEGVEDDRLGQGEAQPLDRGDLVAHLGLARDGLDDLAEDVADADAGADRAEAGADAQRDGLAGLAAVLLRIGGLGDVEGVVEEGRIHCACSFSAPRRRRRRGRSRSGWRR